MLLPLVVLAPEVPDVEPMVSPCWPPILQAASTKAAATGIIHLAMSISLERLKICRNFFKQKRYC